LGDDLTGGSNTFNDDVNAGTSNSNAWGDLLSGDFQEWQVGGELTVPIGYRRAHTAVRHSELAVARERALLKEQERAITLGLSNAVGELRRAFVSMELAKERYEAAINYSLQAKERERTGASTIDVLLEAQRRVLESRLEFLRAEVEFMLAIKNVHFERGTLLEYNQVYLTEEESLRAAQSDAAVRFSRRGRPINYSLRNPTIGQRAQDGAMGTSMLRPIGGTSIEGDAIPAATSEMPGTTTRAQPLVPLSTTGTVAFPVAPSVVLTDGPSGATSGFQPIR
jgi:hypothetical protein